MLSHSHSESLATDGFKVWESHDGVIIEHVAIALGFDSLEDFLAQLVLDVRAVSEELQNARQRVCRGVHPCQDHCPVKALRVWLDLDQIEQDLRDLPDELVVRKPVAFRGRHVRPD